MEGKGEIEIPRRSIKRSKERRKKEVWQHPQLDSNSSISQGDHAMSNDNHNNASSNDYLGLNTSERTSYNSFAASKDSEGSTLLSSSRFDEDDGNDHVDMYKGQYDNHSSNNHIGGDFVEEEDAPPTADDYNDFVLRGTSDNYDEKSETSSFYGSDYRPRGHSNDVFFGYSGNPRSRIMFNLAQRDSSIDLRDTRVDDPVEGEYEL